MFYNVTPAKAVTVRVPAAGLSNYGTFNDGDIAAQKLGQRLPGQGLEQSGGYGTGTVNGSINLKIEALP
jgi:hypothetical protein